MKQSLWVGLGAAVKLQKLPLIILQPVKSVNMALNYILYYILLILTVPVNINNICVIDIIKAVNEDFFSVIPPKGNFWPFLNGNIPKIMDA